MLCFHKEGIVPHESARLQSRNNAVCHQGNSTLNKEYGGPSAQLTLHIGPRLGEDFQQKMGRRIRHG